jgi:enterochelin esterase-like enzyme
MPGRSRDPLAVSTRRQHGERVAYSDPRISDAERAAAGRETVAQRFRALLPANRERAAAQYAEGGLPDGQETARVWFPRDPAALAARLGDQPLTAWAEDGILHVLWRGDAEVAMLSGGLQLPLWPVPAGDAPHIPRAGALGLWEASVRVRRLEEAVLTVMVAAARHDEPLFGRPMGAPVVFRGRDAPADPAPGPLAGELREHVLESAALGGPRGVTVYLPPGLSGGRPAPGCVLADGQSAAGFAPALDAAIRAGTAPPVILAGVHNAHTPDRPGPPRADLRALEYLPRLRSRRFAAHMAFVTSEVIPWAAGQFPVAPGPWTAAGYSNGAVWAIAAGQRRPEVFGQVAALSAGMTPRRIAGRSRQVRHYLGAGTLEHGFRGATSEWAARLQRAGVPCAYQEWAGGHDPWWWGQVLPAALAWLLG